MGCAILKTPKVDKSIFIKSSAPAEERNQPMILSEEIYFEITAKGQKSEIKKLVKFLKSGELDDFMEITSDYFNYNDEYASVDDSENAELIFTNDDLGIEVDEFDTEEFLDVFCKAAKALELVGHLYDINDDEYNFTSEAGDSGYVNSRNVNKFNDELDEAAYNEEQEEN